MNTNDQALAIAMSEACRRLAIAIALDKMSKGGPLLIRKGSTLLVWNGGRK